MKKSQLKEIIKQTLKEDSNYPKDIGSIFSLFRKKGLESVIDQYSKDDIKNAFENYDLGPIKYKIIIDNWDLLKDILDAWYTVRDQVD